MCGAPAVIGHRSSYARVTSEFDHTRHMFAKSRHSPLVYNSRATGCEASHPQIQSARLIIPFIPPNSERMASSPSPIPEPHLLLPSQNSEQAHILR
eukprot:6342882-Prymnesium_polylepis.2